MLTQNIDIKELMEKENISLSSDRLNENDMIVVPKIWSNEKDHIDSISADIIKKIKNRGKKTHIASRGTELEYSEFRGDEYALALFLLKDVVLPIFLNIVITQVNILIEKYKIQKKNDPENKLIKEPVMKVRYYNLDLGKYFELSGPATEVKETAIQLSKK